MPIQVGDLVEFQDARWFVSQRHDGVRTVILRQLDGKSTEIPNDDPGCKVIGNLPTQWPFIALPKKSSQIDRITVAREGRNLELHAMKAWVPADPLHNGGVVYFHPKLRLRPGEVLVAHHQDGTSTRINVTKSYGTVQRKLDMAEAKTQAQPTSMPTRFDHLLLEDD